MKFCNSFMQTSSYLYMLLLEEGSLYIWSIWTVLITYARK